jgi:glutamate dehydrogenase/leucine dehydrogenase
MIERTTVRLPADLLNRAKRKALAERRTLTSLIEEGLRLVVAESQKATKTKRILPRHSDASGPPLAGIDISNSAALQEMEDLEYIERLKNGFK